jgi:ABC-type multidrug transport system fused ATPase/permease subunit
MVHFVRAVAAFFCLFMQTTSLSLAPWWWYYILDHVWYENIWEVFSKPIALWFFLLFYLYILHSIYVSLNIYIIGLKL